MKRFFPWGQTGFIQLLPLLLVLLGVVLGVYLVTHPTFFQPKASSEKDVVFLDSNKNIIQDPAVTDSSNIYIEVNYNADLHHTTGNPNQFGVLNIAPKPALAADLSPAPDSNISCNNVSLSANRLSQLANTNSITFSILGDASTYFKDTFDPPDSVQSCSIDAVKGGTCTVTKSGTWTRTWRHCIGDFNHCSANCSASVGYTFSANPSPTPLPLTCKVGDSSTCPQGSSCQFNTCPSNPPCQPGELCSQLRYGCDPVARCVPNTSPSPSPSPNVTPQSEPGYFKIASNPNELAKAPKRLYFPDIILSANDLGFHIGTNSYFVQFIFSDGHVENALPNFPATISYEPKVTVGNFQVGVNMETATSYGYGDLRPYSKTTDMDTDLKEVQRMGGHLVRVFVANDKISDEEASRRLGAFLDKASSYNISVIPVLIDFYGSGHNPKGTDASYTGSFNGIHVLGSDFFLSNSYRGLYLNFVERVVSDNRFHSNIYAWEIGNELKDDSSPQTFIAFMQDVSSYIKFADPAHSVATGMLSAAHSGLSPDALYSKLPNIDIITVHPYNGDRSQAPDVAWATSHNKKAIIEEIGFSGTSGRGPKYSSEIAYWKNLGASGVLPWGFVAKGLEDNGDGDKSFGFDTLWHSDYDEIFSAMQSFSGVPPSPTPSRTCIAMVAPSKGCTLNRDTCVITCPSPIPTPKPLPSLVPNSCAVCIIQNRPDLLPFYKQNGWDTSSSNYSNIVTDWCNSVSPRATQECYALGNAACAKACGVTPLPSGFSPSPSFTPISSGGRVVTIPFINFSIHLPI